MTTKKQTDGHIGRQVNVRLKDEDAARLDRLTAKHGGVASTIKAALKALEGSNTLTDAELISMLKQRLEAKYTYFTRTNPTDSDVQAKPVKQEMMSGKIIMPPKR